MLSEEKLELYRKMTPAQKWAEWMDIMESGWWMLSCLPEKELDRRLEIMRREHEAVNDRVAKDLR